MSSISSLGIGSGLDLNSLLTSLQNAESAPLQRITAQQMSYTAKLSAYGQLQGAIGALGTAAGALAKASLYEGITANSSATNVSVKADPDAAIGSYAVNVTQLAQAQSLAADGVASSSTAIGSGTLKIEFGSIDASNNYVADGARGDTLVIDNTNNTLAGIRKAINDKSSLGVTASIVNDGSGTPYRLVLTSKTTGEASIMRISVSGEALGDTGLSDLLTYDPTGVQAMSETSAAQNTKMTVNNILVTSSNNKFENAVDGVTLTVSGTGTGTVSISKDTESISKAIDNFVTAYNGLQGVAASLGSYDAANKKGGILLGDSVLLTAQRRVRNLLTTPQSGGAFTMLSQIGISFTKAGTLTVEYRSKLNSALSNNMADVMKLFSGENSVGGYGRQLSSMASSFNGTNGLLQTAQDGINTTIKGLDRQYSATEDRINATMAKYKAQFQQLDTMMAQMNRTSSYLTQQFSALNGTSKK
jgi:flagellar hook-associated protein 2